MSLKATISEKFDNAQARMDRDHSLETADTRMKSQIDWEGLHPERSRRSANHSGNFLKKSLAVGATVVALVASVELIGRAVDQSIQEHTHSAPTLTHSGHEKP